MGRLHRPPRRRDGRRRRAGAPKEAAALAISVVKHCDGCIAHNARAAAHAGATRNEVAEMLGLALLMDGGPATVYAPRAWEAFEEFAEAELAGNIVVDAGR